MNEKIVGASKPVGPLWLLVDPTGQHDALGHREQNQFSLGDDLFVVGWTEDHDNEPLGKETPSMPRNF